MRPDENKLDRVERKLDKVLSWMAQFDNPSQVEPQVALTIRTIVGAVRLSDLEDVTGTDSATNGQVLKYNGSEWAPGTDNIA